MTIDSGSKPLPILRAHLREPFTQVIAAGTYTFDKDRIRKMNDRAVYVIEDPCQLVYDEPEITFEAPAGRYIWLTLVAGRVAEIVAGVTKQALTMEMAYEAASCIDDSLSKLLFDRKQTLRMRLSDIRREMGQVVSDRYELPLAKYWRKDVQWTLRLDWLGAGVPSPEQAYVLVMRWSSSSVEDELMSSVYERRMSTHGDDNEALPMSVWTNDLTKGT